MTADHDPTAVAADIERLIQKMGALGDADARAQAQELVRLLMTLYGAGLSRILDIVRTEQGGSDAIVGRLATDSLVASLLVLHDLHPHPVAARVERALAALRPHLPQVEIVLEKSSEDAIRVRVDRGHVGDCMSDNAVRVAVERAIQEAAPEIGTIHIDGLSDAQRTLIQIVRRPEVQPASS